MVSVVWVCDTITTTTPDQHHHHVQAAAKPAECQICENAFPLDKLSVWDGCYLICEKCNIAKCEKCENECTRDDLAQVQLEESYRQWCTKCRQGHPHNEKCTKCREWVSKYGVAYLNEDTKWCYLCRTDPINLVEFDPHLLDDHHLASILGCVAGLGRRKLAPFIAWLLKDKRRAKAFKGVFRLKGAHNPCHYWVKMTTEIASQLLQKGCAKGCSDDLKEVCDFQNEVALEDIEKDVSHTVRMSDDSEEEFQRIMEQAIESISDGYKKGKCVYFDGPTEIAYFKVNEAYTLEAVMTRMVHRLRKMRYANCYSGAAANRRGFEWETEMKCVARMIVRAFDEFDEKETAKYVLDALTKDYPTHAKADNYSKCFRTVVKPVINGIPELEAVVDKNEKGLEFDDTINAIEAAVEAEKKIAMAEAAKKPAPTNEEVLAMFEIGKKRSASESQEQRKKTKRGV